MADLLRHAFTARVRAIWLDATFVIRRAWWKVRVAARRSLRSQVSVFERLAAVAVLAGLGWLIGGPVLSALAIVAGLVAIGASGAGQRVDAELDSARRNIRGGREP